MNAAASVELEHIWPRVQTALTRAVGEPVYRIWLAPLQPLEMRDGSLVIAVPAQALRWVHDRFGQIIATAVREALGSDTPIELVSASAHSDGASGRAADVTGPARRRGVRPSAAGSPTQGDPALEERPGPLSNPKLTFDQFVIGDCNRLAHAAALTVAELPAQAYNPLFICGPPGVGKTHLLSSIANMLLCHSPGLAVSLTTGEAFTNAFLGALSSGHTESFKARFRHIDVLLVDDVQFFERKTRTEEEFFHTFNALYDGGRQIVLTSDRPPHDLQALEDRLRERFESGLVADIAAPDLPTRMAILRKRAQHDGIQLADELALRAIADRVDTNVRALEGALIRVVAFSSLTGRPLTSELAREVLESLYPRAGSAGSVRTIAEIQAAACEQFGLSAEELVSSARTPRVAWPRQLAMYLARELTAESLPAIGREFGGRDHTTVMHACRRATSRIAEDDAARSAVRDLCKRLGAQQP